MKRKALYWNSKCATAVATPVAYRYEQEHLVIKVFPLLRPVYTLSLHDQGEVVMGTCWIGPCGHREG